VCQLVKLLFPQSLVVCRGTPKVLSDQQVAAGAVNDEQAMEAHGNLLGVQLLTGVLHCPAVIHHVRYGVDALPYVRFMCVFFFYLEFTGGSSTKSLPPSS
jgi:hypothetical protein